MRNRREWDSPSFEASIRRRARRSRLSFVCVAPTRPARSGQAGLTEVSGPRVMDSQQRVRCVACNGLRPVGPSEGPSDPTCPTGRTNRARGADARNLASWAESEQDSSHRTRQDGPANWRSPSSQRDSRTGPRAGSRSSVRPPHDRPAPTEPTPRGRITLCTTLTRGRTRSVPRSCASVRSGTDDCGRRRRCRRHRSVARSRAIPAGMPEPVW